VLPVPQCPGGHVARFSVADNWPGRPLRWPLLRVVVKSFCTKERSISNNSCLCKFAKQRASGRDAF